MDDDNARYDSVDWHKYAPEGNEWCVALDSSRWEGLTLITKWTANTMGEDEPMRFYTQAWGGTGDYYYSFASPQIFDGVDKHPTLVDPLNKAFNEEYGYGKRGAFSFEFYASEKYQLRTHVLDKRYGELPMSSASDAFNVILLDENYPSVADRVNNIAEACEKATGTDASQYEKALWMHDYLIDNATYDLRYVKAEGVLARGRGNCESYHAAYTRLLNAVGIQTGRVDSTQDNHVWTAANLDGEWCQIDVNWDDVDYRYTPFDLRHLYFGLTDKLIGYSHKGHTAAVAGYESSSLNNNYLIRSGVLADRVDELAEEVEAQLKKGNTSFEINEKNSDYLYWAQAYDGDTKTIYNNLLAYELEKRQWEVSLNGVSNKGSISITYDNVSNGQNATLFSGSYAVHAKFEATDGHAHNWENIEIVDQPTCLNSGLQVKTCSTCGTQIIEPTPIADHAWSGYVVTKKPTCTAAGQSTSTCSTCGEQRTKEVQATGHAWSGYVVTKKPTCTAAGRSTSTCSKCGQTRSQTQNAVGHTWGGWVRTKAPTTSAAGVDTRVCKKCNVTQERNVAKLPPVGRWVSSGGKWWYSYSRGGYPANCWEHIDDFWYHFDRSGWMQTGWQRIGGIWYYLKPSGAMATGWCKVGGAWYYLNSSGAMQANRWIGNYYVTGSGAMATNTWIGRYHVNASGLWDKTR